jgi:hypothetical protein
MQERRVLSASLEMLLLLLLLNRKWVTHNLCMHVKRVLSSVVSLISMAETVGPESRGAFFL